MIHERIWEVIFERLDSLLGKEIYLVQGGTEIWRGVLMSYEPKLDHNTYSECKLYMIDKTYSIDSCMTCIPMHDKLRVNFDAYIKWED